MSKIRIIIMMLISSFIGIIANPEMMTASDHVAISGMDASRIVETVPLPEPKISTNAGGTYEMVPEYEVAEAGEDAWYEEPVYEEPVYEVYEVYEEEPVYEAPANNIQIAGNTVELGWTNTTEENAGAATYGWYYKTGQFIYAHNYAYVFGVLDTAYDNGYLNGMSFSVTMDGATRYYTVTDSAVYTYNQTAAKMSGIIHGGGHALAIMTCYGHNNERLVLYAD